MGKKETQSGGALNNQEVRGSCQAFRMANPSRVANSLGASVFPPENRNDNIFVAHDSLLHFLSSSDILLSYAKQLWIIVKG